MRIPLDIPPGLVADDTAFSANGRWVDGSNVRFRLGKPQVIGGWESVTAEHLSGVCRSVLPWTDNAATLNLAFGTHSHLQLYQGGALFDITPADLVAGAVDGTGSTGYGTGGYGVGGYNAPSSADYFPRTWSLAAWGQELLASPRGGKLYTWQNSTASPATEIAAAPDEITHMLVASQDQVFALGCNEEVSGTFNPLCVRHSSVRNNTEWTTGSATTAREYILPGGGRIVAGRVLGPYVLVWTTDALFLGSFVGSLSQPWRFDRVGRNCGLAGPGAAVVVGQAAFWVSPDRQFFRCGLGGAPEPIPCPIREDFADNLAASQADKIVASSISEFSEVRFDYPDARDGYENSRYLALCIAGPDAGAWHRGVMARTAMVDAGPSLYPCGVTPDGAVYWHERGTSADGAALSWRLSSGDSWLDQERVVTLRGVWPDFRGQAGAVNLDLITRLEPQGAERAFPTRALAAGERKADVRATGRIVRVTLSGSSSPASCRIGRLVFDVTGTGGR